MGPASPLPGPIARSKIWDAAGKEQFQLDGHKDWVSSVAFHSNNTTLASASHDRSVKLWDLNEKKETATLGPYKSSVWSVAFSPDGSLLASGSHKEGVRVWNVAEKKEVFPRPMADEKKPEEKK